MREEPLRTKHEIPLNVLKCRMRCRMRMSYAECPYYSILVLDMQGVILYVMLDMQSVLFYVMLDMQSILIYLYI